jgi:SAM-dependent methyltransferase
MKRNCEICGSKRKSYIYTPVFCIPDQKLPFKYDIALCKRCGFLFADNIPSRKEYETFYRNNAKYAYNGDIPKGLKRLYYDIFSLGSNFLKKYYPGSGKEIRVLDIGCSIGYILNLFKRSGFRDIRGIEPSSRCRAAAKKLYGIEVVNLPLSKFKSNEKFGLIIMTGVLEHVSDLNETLRKVSDLLDDDGLLMIVVPDVDKFSGRPAAPFDEFSTEHINYFNKGTLSNLAGKHRFKNIYIRTIAPGFYDSGSIFSMFKKTKKAIRIKSDRRGYSAIKRYIIASERKLDMIKRGIRRLIKSGSPIAVWGAGSLTSRLLAATDLLMADIKFFVDSNKTLQGKRLSSITITSPSIFKRLGQNYKVFISSHIYGREMKDILIKKYGFKGEAVML